MPEIISDDIGSFPLPEGVGKEEIQRIAFEIVTKKAADSDRERFNKIVGAIMQKKIDSGIHRPNFPQIQDMISEFFKFVEDFYEEDEPWVVKREFARIPELSAIEEVARRFYESKGRALESRVCVTGPLELYVKKVGTQVQGDLLRNLARSVSRFVENSMINKEHIKTKTICIDEPSLGLNPNILAEKEDLIKAWETSAEKAKNLDVQIHLHSPADSELIYAVNNINVIGIESAEDPKAFDEIDKKDMERYDKFLRAGIARTNIYGITADFRDKTGIDPWKEKNFSRVIDETESSKTIEKRLKNAHKIFGDRIKYAGPDCGLGAWPDQDSAFKLLRNTVKAIDNFNES
jgi:5-methyltetrahydropteroyltriglutamate--homocysteine methyltransferase